MSGPTSIDAICRGELRLEQPVSGYRFNVDSIILADFVERTGGVPAGAAVDLGAGCGVVGLLLARRRLARSVLLVEVQQELANLAAGNIARNNLEDRVAVRGADLRRHDSWIDAPFDLVVCNPPFFPRAAGRVSVRPQVAVARHELSCELRDVVVASEAALRSGGALAMIHTASRLDEVLATLRKGGLAPQVLQGVRPLPRSERGRVLLRAIKGGSPKLRELPELVVEDVPGVYSAPMRRVLRDES